MKELQQGDRFVSLETIPDVSIISFLNDRGLQSATRDSIRFNACLTRYALPLRVEEVFRYDRKIISARK